MIRLPICCCDNAQEEYWPNIKEACKTQRVAREVFLYLLY